MPTGLIKFPVHSIHLLRKKLWHLTGHCCYCLWLYAKRCARKEDRGTKKIKLTGCEWVMHFFLTNPWSHPPVKGENGAALRSWEIWLSAWFVTICWTLHVTASPHHCATNHAVNCKKTNWDLNVIRMSITKWAVVVLCPTEQHTNYYA